MPASHKLCSSPKRTVTIANELQVNCPIGTFKNSGLITYLIIKERQKSSSMTGTTATAPNRREPMSAYRRQRLPIPDGLYPTGVPKTAKFQVIFIHRIKTARPVKTLTHVNMGVDR